MMGVHEEQPGLFAYNVNLDARVRPDHPLRAVRGEMDFGFVRTEVAGFYGSNGHVSVDPVIIMKLMFLLFFDDVASERELMRIVPERLDYLWFLGYGIEDSVPGHSVLSKARRRWGADVFESLFVRIVSQCVEAGLVDGTKIHMDGSLVDADASRDAVVKGPPELIAALKSTYRAQAGKLDDTEQAPARPSDYVPQNRTMVNTTDPDAAMVRQSKTGSRPRYKHHRAIDDHCGVITALETTPGDVEENARLLALLEQHEQTTGARVDTVVADTQYGTADNFRACRERGVNTHMGDMLAAQSGQARRSEIFGIDDFVYDAATDTYCCPAGQTLARRKYKKARNAYEYACPRKICAACPLRGQCTRAKDGQPRTIKRHVNQEAIDEGRAQSRSRKAKRDRVRRKWLMEGSFADAANNHGFKRARWRRLLNQQIQGYLIAAIQNIRILLRQTARFKKAQTMVLPVRQGRRMLQRPNALVRAQITPAHRYFRVRQPIAAI